MKGVEAYVFYVDGWAKIGHAGDVEQRLYHLMWGGRPPYAPTNPFGELLARASFPSKEEAISAERCCQDLLHAMLKLPRPKAGGMREWFKVAADLAVSAFNDATASPNIALGLSAIELNIVHAARRRHGLPSVEAAIRMLLVEALEARGEI